jgi:hypothetical protein
MAQNNVLAEGVEKLGCRTFSTEEMAFNIVGLLHQSIADIAMTHPIWADFTGGMDKVEGLDRAMAEMRKVLYQPNGDWLSQGRGALIDSRRCALYTRMVATSSLSYSSATLRRT